MVGIIVDSHELRRLARRALDRASVGEPLVLVDTSVSDPAAWTLSNRVSLLIHDFRPSPEASIARLGEAAERMGGLDVYALLPAPASDVVDLLLRSSSLPFHLAGVALASELDADALALRLGPLVGRRGFSHLAPLLVSELGVDPVLARVVACTVRVEPTPRTVAGLLRVSGMSRRELVALTRASGFARPVDFLRLVRSLMALHLVRRGLTVAGAAEAVGYGSADRFRVHCRQLFGGPPAALVRVPDRILLRGLRSALCARPSRAERRRTAS